MIHRIFSTLPSFKELRFHQGFNLLLADKTEASSAKDTRNGAGKSSLLEIIHFLTAGECPEESIFRDPKLVDHRFGMEFDLGGQIVRVERSAETANEVLIDASAGTENWPVQPELSDETGASFLTNRDWERVLGSLMFGLSGAPRSKGQAYAPTFRNLFAYFVRRRSGGFSQPHLHFVQAKPYTWQVALTYLLGLDWGIPQEWQSVRDIEEQIKQLKKAVGEGDLADIVGKRAQLRADIASAEAALSRARVRVADFRVLPDFRAYEEEASALTQQIGDRSNANTSDEDLLAHLDSAIAEEQPVATSNLEQMYRQAGVLLPDAALRRFDEVRSFHDSVIANRKLYLTGEMEAARKRIADREAEKQALSERRAQLMGILQSHGALDQFTKLQSELSRKEAALELLQRRFKAAEKIEQGLTKQNIRRQELLLRLRQDYAEQAETLNRAIVLFEEVSAELYERPARFTPTETLNGPAFTIDGQADRSPGIANMQIFCFDVMLSRLMAERGLGPGILVHDSHIFDPVDSRQVGSALQYASKMADDLGIQYIVTLNSDKQLEFPVSFDLKPHLLSSKLTDAAETGGLFGLRFG
jgi:uncharacterized protein YydD (DUF2326 family)